jgi:hypothetical protein
MTNIKIKTAGPMYNVFVLLFIPTMYFPFINNFETSRQYQAQSLEAGKSLAIHLSFDPPNNDITKIRGQATNTTYRWFHEIAHTHPAQTTFPEINSLD